MHFMKSRLSNKAKENLYYEVNTEITEHLQEKIELLDKFLCIPKEETKYDGLNDILADGMNNWADDKITLKELLKQLQLSEQFLKALIYIVNKKKFDEINEGSESFKNAIIFIGLTKLNQYGNLDLKLSAREVEQGFSLEKKFSDAKYKVPNQLHWARTYNFRNEEAHQLEKYTTSKISNTIMSILYVVLESTWKYREIIEREYLEQQISQSVDRNDYCRTVVREYESKRQQDTFIVMNCTRLTTNMDSILDDYDLDDEKETAREVESILNRFRNPEDKNQMYIKIIGEAGLGKSRLMKHLAYEDAKAGDILPVYVELKELSDARLEVETLVENTIGMDHDICTKLLSIGQINLYLDGVNEILCSDRNKKIVCSHIDELAVKYPKARIIVSDRVGSSITTKRDVLTFALSKLNNNQIMEFIQKNVTSEKSLEVIKKIISKNETLLNITRTPFMAETFIKLVEQGGYRSGITNEMNLVKAFIDSLIEREAHAKNEVRADKIKLLLPFLLKDRYNTENGKGKFSVQEVLIKFSNAKNLYGFEISTIETLEIITQMGLLERISNGDYYCFPNEIYELHFLTEADKIIG